MWDNETCTVDYFIETVFLGRDWCHFSRAMGSAASAVPDTPESELQRYALHLPPSQRLVAHEKSADTKMPGNQRKKISEGCLRVVQQAYNSVIRVE